MSESSNPADYQPPHVQQREERERREANVLALADYCKRLDELHPLPVEDWQYVADSFCAFMDDDAEGVTTALVWDREAVHAVAMSRRTPEIRERAWLYFEALADAKARREGLRFAVERAAELDREDVAQRECCDDPHDGACRREVGR